MPRQPQNTVENSFIKGLITQATGLNFPENACTDTDNCIFSDIGSVYRRPGIDLEAEFETKTVDRTEKALASYTWKNVANDANLTFIVQQVGSVLYFYDAISYANISKGALVDTVDLEVHIPNGGPDPSTSECQFASGRGILLVTHPTLEPFYISYDPDTLTFTDTEIDIRIRDFAGEVDELDIDERQSSSYAGISFKHHYNLLNQGWTASHILSWNNARADLPSNVDVIWNFKNSSDVFDVTTVPNVIAGNSPAPKGHFIMNVFNQDRTTVSSIANLTTTSSEFRRTSTGAFFAGRAWYSGVDHQNYKGQIYFSPIIENLSQLGTCHQINDPTSETLFDLLPTDGGVIDIQEAGTILKLLPVLSFLIVFATNGVWAISGSQGVGFTTTDYSIQKIAEIPSISASSFVMVDGFPMWWNFDGIYMLQPSENGGLEIKSLTDTTIRDFYLAIPENAKLYARGAFNRVTKVIQWIYRDEDVVTISDRYNFNRALNFNLQTTAFYPWSFVDQDPHVNGIHFIESVGETVSVENVVDGDGTLVVDGGGEQVIVYIEAGIVTPRFVYTVTYEDGDDTLLTFALVRDTNYEDWASHTNTTDYDSYFTTGYKVHGNALNKFQSNYVYIYTDNSDPGEFYFRGKWDYALSSATGRWTTNQILTYTDTDYAFRYKRIKVRGHGQALQFTVSSRPNAPFNIIGWAIFETVNKWV